jgi:hypothetical protein
VYVRGVLRLAKPFALADGTHVEVIVIPRESRAEAGNPAEILAGIAALPLDHPHHGGPGMVAEISLLGMLIDLLDRIPNPPPPPPRRCRQSVSEEQTEAKTIRVQLDFLRRYVELHDHDVAGEHLDKA